MTPPFRLRRLAQAAAAVAVLTLAACASVAPVDAGDDPATPVAAAPAPDAAASAAQSTALVVLPADAAPAEDEGPAVEAPIDPLRPEVHVDLDDRAASLDLWGRVRGGFALADLDTPLVRQWEQWYAARPDYVERMTTRGSRYLFHIMEEVNKRGMPTELALLPFIESAFNPEAMSVAKASGMWQFVPATGRDFDLKQNIFRDDRRDVLASTRAALDYLGRLNAEFNDWQLTLAAYNWGIGNVRRAIARNQRAGLPTDYLSLRMPAETQQYVPKLQAVKNIIAHPEAFSLTLPELANHPYFLSVPIARDMDVDLAAQLAELSPEQFKQLNPQLNKPVILAAGTPQVLLPYDNANVFVRNIQQHRGPLATWTAWVAPKTLRPADAARQVGMSEERLREVNRIPPRMLVKAGSTLLVPRSGSRTEDVSGKLADHAMIALAPEAPPQRRVTVRAGRKGESVASVARRYGLSSAMVAQWNKLPTSGSFKAGQAIALVLPAASPRAAASSRVATSGTRVAAPKAVKVASGKSAKPAAKRKVVSARKPTTIRVAKQ